MAVISVSQACPSWEHLAPRCQSTIAAMAFRAQRLPVPCLRGLQARLLARKVLGEDGRPHGLARARDAARSILIAHLRASETAGEALPMRSPRVPAPHPAPDMENASGSPWPPLAADKEAA